MKIYEKPSVDIKRFDVEDVMMVSTYEVDNGEFADITKDGTTRTGVVFEW